MKICFLGTGTSTGVPELGCNCRVCKSEDHRDKRLRTSILIECNGRKLLFDCGPDFRQQMLTENNRHIDAVFITHEHYDHTGGLDDLRPFSKGHPLPVFAEENVSRKLKQRMPYCFGQSNYPGVPNLQLKEISTEEMFFCGIKIIPIRVMHGKLPILGFRVGNFAYLTDMTGMPDSEYQKLQGLDLLVIAALRKKMHNTHQNYDEALAQIDKIKPDRSLLIHASHDLGLHLEVSKELPASVELSYDGLVIEI